MPFRILSIDGGGIRGIIPALILQEMERRAGKPVSEMFDLVAGTSTGGILTLGLLAPGRDGKPRYSARDLVALYEDDGPKIFHRPLFHKIRAVGYALEEKYPAAGIEEVLRDRFGDTWLSECIVPALVTAYDLELREPHFFKSDRAVKFAGRDFRMADVARATSAAPTYFEPARVQSRAEDDPVALVDGGVFANNPSACALVEAIIDHGADPSDMVMLSLGTGEMTRPIMYDDAKGWGLVNWAQPVLNVVFDGVSDTVSYQVQSILESTSGKGSYLRLQTDLHEGNDDMDDAGTTNIRVLKLLAKKIAKHHKDDIDAMLKKLGC